MSCVSDKLKSGFLLCLSSLPVLFIAFLACEFAIGVNTYITQIEQAREQAAIEWLAKQSDKEYGAAVLITYQKCREEKTETSESCLSVIGDRALYTSVIDAEVMIPLPSELDKWRNGLAMVVVESFVGFYIG
ncbi:MULTISPECIES: hypothetical protein [Aeromonas]|uniref:Uncharacterized protein n=1 Tax=Aeromonas veronii TaxID=654 RepID=A0A2T4MWP9_AERVE|nr:MULTISPECIES: hypothetical protein [Aeromonas]MBP4081942.1 hypothetical protein [Aeromonas sp. MrichA-1]PTH78965.1 hypothetical protein DAA48_21235 [Aeromonas veronii]